MVTVTITPHAAGETEDDMGDVIMAPGVPFEVEAISIYPASSAEPWEANRSLVKTGLVILAPEASRAGDATAHDTVTIPGYPGVWEIVGEVARWDDRSNPVRRRGFRVGTRRPGLNIGCIQINVEKVDG